MDRFGQQPYRKRPTHGVLNPTRMMILGSHLPQLFQTNAIGLVLIVGIQVEMFHKLLGELTSTAFAKDGTLGMELHASLETVLGRAVLANTHIIRGNSWDHKGRMEIKTGRRFIIKTVTEACLTFDTAVIVEQNLGGAKARIDLHPQSLGLFTQPLNEMAHSDNVVTVVVHGEALQNRNRNATRFGQDGKFVLGHRGFERSVSFTPIRKQFVQRGRLQTRARQNVSAYRSDKYQWGARDPG